MSSALDWRFFDEIKLTKPLFPPFSFDLKNSNVNDSNLEEVKTEKLPDVVLVKKVYADKARRNRRRKWRLKRLAKEQVRPLVV